MKEKYTLRIVVYCLLMFILGVVLLYFSWVHVSDEVFKEIGKSIGVAIITAAFFTVVINTLQKSHLDNKLSDILENKIPFLYRIMNFGITGIEDQFPLQSNINEPSFINSDVVNLVFNDGKRFYQNNITIFRKRFAQKGKKTRFILMNPESSDSISVLTRKNGHDGDYYKDKIKNFISILEKENNEYDHEIEIYIHDLFTTMSIITTDSYVMLSLYRISPGQAVVPHLVLEKNNSEFCEYTKVMSDVAKLIKYSKRV